MKAHAQESGRREAAAWLDVFPVMVIEQQNGNALVHLGPKLWAYPEELIRQHHSHNGHMEYLIRWNVHSSENGSAGASFTETRIENILMWMTADDVYANCPTLLGKRNPKEQQVEQKVSSTYPPDVMLDEASLLEMKADVKNLVQRAAWQMASTTVPQSSILNTIHVLSAYASIGSLMDVFKETGALDLLLKMLSNEEKQIRGSASKMLRALASHNAGSRAYVLLSLSQQDGIEQHMDFDSCYTLLELFAETTSTEEHSMTFEGIPLPQIPGKLLFSLVKRYLCATSLMDKLNSTRELRSESEDPSSNSGGKKRIQYEFDFSMAMASLISELVQVMGWDHSQDLQPLKDKQVQDVQSIFQPQTPTCATIQSAMYLSQKETTTFKMRSAFPSRSSYVEYLQETLVRGMRVCMLEDYEKVCAGDMGEFLQSCNGTPPVQVYWESLDHIYWVYWHMIEIAGSSGRAEQQTQEKLSSLKETLRQDAVPKTWYYKPLWRLYPLPYLVDQVDENPGVLSQAAWWELLFFLKKLEPQKQQDIVQFIQQNQKLSKLDEEDLIQLSVSAELAQKVLQLLSKQCQGCTRSDLQSSHVYLKYFFSKGQTKQSSANVNIIPSECAVPSEAMVSKNPKKQSFSSEVSSPLPSLTEKTDTQLMKELLKVEEPSFPGTLNEKAKAFCSVKVAGKTCVLEQLADALEMIQKSGGDIELQMAGLLFITKIVEEEPGQERQDKQTIKVEGELAMRKKIVKMLVELLSHQVKEKLFVVLVLQTLYVLLAKYDLRILFAATGGLNCVLHCMQEHSVSVLVQQTGLAVMKVLLGIGNCEAPGSSRKPYPLNHSDAKEMQEIFASIDSDSGKVSNRLLCAIPAALEKMLDTPGASSAVQNGLLVLKVLINNHKGLAEQLGKCGLHAVLQSCCHAGQSSNKMLAQIVLSCLVEHKVLLTQESADSAISFDVKDIDVAILLSDLCKNNISKQMVIALEHCLHSKDACFEDNGYEFLADVLLLKDLAQLGSEKDVQLGALRLLRKLLDNAQEDTIPWNECIEPCLSAMSAHINDREVVQEFIGFLHCLATLSKDCTVMMCCLGTKETLTKVLEKHGSGLLLVTELRDHLRDCEKYACLYKKMTASVLAGCIQMVLGQIEEHRRSHQPINIPFFDVFLHNLCQGFSVEVKKDKCWEKVEVSSNPHWASKLMDGNPKTYWESNGNTGSHYINVYMSQDVVVQQMSLLVASEDSSYMPARIIVMGRENTSSISTKLNVVAVPSSASRVILLENLSCFWPIIQIKIKRCHQSGIDTRVRGLEVLGPKPTFWPIFKEQLCLRTNLFYTTKAHTWCREISEDRMQLLHLFSKLNSTLRHEQMFANRFLPNDKAAQALGKTCWEALINPLVQSITSSDPSGISPLSWLLNRYLENMKAGQNTKSQATIFNSHVRHLSHLLVHVDSSSSESKKLKPPVKSNGKKSSETSGATKPAADKLNSMTGIMQCWKGVVQQQVKQFLESSWQVPDFVERYCNTYLHLCTAMEELFGQQMSFMLALCQGFSEALQQLSFPTTMHVSQQFARYIDRWIQKNWVDSGNMETLQHLQQSLEPILFLSGLELANTFERFYQYFLGDRLLSRGKTWLECAVVEHIGLCFPNRFPQQMLKNLSELEEQQQQFHLFQLQQLDQRLLKLDQDGKCEEGKIMEEEPCPQEKKVDVLALSLQCWTISPLWYLEEPTRFFPTSLSQHLGEFADFYIQSQSCFEQDHTKPRHLQWTWLGCAELEYQGCILHVSTLQMYILLCFNCSEEVFVESMLQSTGLSCVLLNLALKPLTKKNGILSQSQGTLRLNKGALSHLSGQHLWLLPKKTYLNVEEEGGNALEKRRNIICCLVIEILKEEKTIHIDKLVFRVIDVCQTCKPATALKFLSFCCSSADVLSCILHLLNKGYIQRKEDQPQLLQYVFTECPTVVLPKNRAQVAFQTVQIKKVPSVPCTEKKQTFSTFSKQSNSLLRRTVKATSATCCVWQQTSEGLH